MIALSLALAEQTHRMATSTFVHIVNPKTAEIVKTARVSAG